MDWQKRGSWIFIRGRAKLGHYLAVGFLRPQAGPPAAAERAYRPLPAGSA